MKDSGGIVGSRDVESGQSNICTLWVEPNTAVILKRTEAQDSTLRYDGTDRVTTAKVTTGYDDKTVEDNVDQYLTLGRILHLLLHAADRVRDPRGPVRGRRASRA